ncbi:MAG: metallophosphatase family protein [Clostridia bacterium]|nr:metallophosphatase family protein [Clostridia bacterium]
MKFAAIGDIHSNLYALESVLADIAKKDVDFIICTGDSLGYSPFPNEVLHLLRKNHVLSIQGNYEKAVGNFEMICGCDYKEPRLIELAALSMEFTNKHISDENRNYIKNLPKHIRLHSEAFDILVVHGSPRRINEPLYEGSGELKEVLENMNENVLVCGHTHEAFYQQINGKHVINCGTVGKPVNGSIDATYTLIDIIGSTISVQLERISYDVEKAAKAIEENDELPDDFAQMLRQGTL